MGQKVNPHGMRVGIIKDWNSKWYAEADFSDNLVEDYNIRKFLKKKLYSAGVSKIDIERASDRVKIIIFTAKPGIVIGKGGAEIEKLKGELAPYVNGKKVFVDIKEVKRPDKEAVLVAENIAAQLENRVSFRRAMKSVMSRAMKSGALGIKTTCSGRLGGVYGVYFLIPMIVLLYSIYCHAFVRIFLVGITDLQIPQSPCCSQSRLRLPSLSLRSFLLFFLFSWSFRHCSLC